MIPILNEEASLPLLRRSLEEWIPTAGTQVEVVIVDDGSTDGSFSLLRTWAKASPRVRVLSLSRNFGHQIALTAGLDASRGDAVVMMDGDLQDPLDVVNAMLQRFRQGYDVVYGTRRQRLGETVFKKSTAWLFYRLMRRFVHRDLPSDAGDFRLVSRRALDAALSLRERRRFLRGLFTWIGFRQATVSYVRQERRHGQGKYSLRKMLRLAWDATFSFSLLPVRLASYLGLGVAALGIAYGGMALLLRWAPLEQVESTRALLVMVALLGGLVLLFLGIIGEYIGRIYEEVRRRPLYLVRERLNFE